MHRIDRAGFLALAGRTGAGLTLAGAGAGALAAEAGAASGPISDTDLALARLASAAELLSIDFYGKAIEAGLWRGDALKAARRALFNEQEHLAAVSGILTGAGQAASSADDFEFAYPEGALASAGAAARVAVTIETASVGIYVGAAGAFAAADLRTAAAAIAASEGQHLGFFTHLAGGRAIGISFPAALDLAAASDALAPFLG